MNSWNIIGHDWAVEMLQKQIINQNVRHAYLITGPDGVGRRTLAIRFAQAFCCEAHVAPAFPCLECKTCKTIETGKHFDLMNISRLVDEDKKGIGVKQVREIGKFITRRPYAGDWKFIIFQNFEDASISAQNALLKTLEEAPPYVILLLTVGNTEQLLPTTVSRCEIINLRPLIMEDMTKFLSTRDKFEGDLDLIAHLSDGRPGYAYSLAAEENHFLGFRAEKLDELRMILKNGIRERIRFSEKLVKDRDKFDLTLHIWLSFWRDVFNQSAGSNAEVTNIDRKDEIKNLAEKISMKQAYKITRDLESAITRLGRNVNSRLLAEVTLMDWPELK